MFGKFSLSPRYTALILGVIVRLGVRRTAAKAIDVEHYQQSLIKYMDLQPSMHLFKILTIKRAVFSASVLSLAALASAQVTTAQEPVGDPVPRTLAAAKPVSLS